MSDAFIRLDGCMTVIVYASIKSVILISGVCRVYLFGEVKCCVGRNIRKLYVRGLLIKRKAFLVSTRTHKRPEFIIALMLLTTFGSLPSVATRASLGGVTLSARL